VSDAAGRLCRHFGVCGGCAFQDKPYGEQLAAKEQIVRHVVEPFRPERFLPIRPSPQAYFYRNKMEFAFGGVLGGPALLGLREKGRFNRIVSLEECLLLSPEVPALLESVRRWADEEKVPTYHLRAHKGFLRYLAVREGKNTGERMVHLVTAPGELPRDSFLAALKRSGVPVTSAVWSVNEALSDVAYGKVSAVLSGSGSITEELLGRRFRISPTAFFQTNTRGAEILYKIVAEALGGGAETLFDFYCGSGAIGLCCADAGRRVIGVEVHAPAVEDARLNAREQGADRAEFHAADAAAFVRLPEWMSLWGSPSTAAVFDPPRTGLSAPVRELLVTRPLERWIYVSCNPEALARDLPALAGTYRLESVQPVDLFPHTEHVETVLLFHRRPPA